MEKLPIILTVACFHERLPIGRFVHSVPSIVYGTGAGLLIGTLDNRVIGSLVIGA